MINLRLNARLLLQLPLLFLGSCTPVTPNTSIVIYTVEQPAASKQKVIKPLKKTSVQQTTNPLTQCERDRLGAMEAYKIPELPDLSGINPDDDEAVVNALLDHIAKLRKEFRALTDDPKCTSTGSPKV